LIYRKKQNKNGTAQTIIGWHGVQPQQLTNMEQAQWVLNVQSPQPSDSLLEATGEAIGNNAAHEIAHELSNAFPKKIVGGMGLDDSSIDTYNSGSCDGSIAPWVYTGVGTDGQTPIHWESGNADTSLANILGRKN
jgi:hypothetical protein